MNFEEQIKRHKEISQKIEELEEEKKALSISIMEQMEGKSVQVADFLVKRFQRLSIKLSLEEARLHSATKMEETVDKDKLKLLYHQGFPIQGISEIHYIQISKLSSKR